MWASAAPTGPMAAAWSAANAATRHNEKFRMPGLNGFALSLPSYEQDFGPSFTMKEMRDEKDTDHHGGGGHCPGNSSCLGSDSGRRRSEEHTSELQSLMRISYAAL